jgi:hypothetical protein
VPVDEAEHKLQVLSDARSPAALQFLGYASAAQRASGVRRLVPPVLLRLLQPEDRLALGEGEPHPLLDRVRLFARERENVAQEGFDALVHWVCPLYRLSASRIAVRLRRLRAGPEKAVLVEPGGRGCEFTFLVHPTCRGTPDDRNKQMVAKFNGWREPQAALVR